MVRTVDADGRWVPESEAKMSVVDRPFPSTDAVREVTAVVGGRRIDDRSHAARLARWIAVPDTRSPALDARLLDLHRGIAARDEGRSACR